MYGAPEYQVAYELDDGDHDQGDDDGYPDHVIHV